MKAKGLEWPASDQKVYVSDIRRAKTLLDWESLVSVKDGVCSTVEWISKNIGLFA